MDLSPLKLVLITQPQSFYVTNTTYFRNNYISILDKYKYADAYFFYKSHKIYVSTVGAEFFDNYDWALYLCVDIIVFHFVQRRNFNPGQYATFQPNYINQDIVFLPFMWFERGAIYDQDAGFVRAIDNNYYHIHSVGGKPVSFLRESPISPNKSIYSNPVPVIAYTTTNALITPKTAPTGVPFTTQTTILIGNPQYFDVVLIYNLVAGTTVQISSNLPNSYNLETNTIKLTQGLNIIYTTFPMTTQPPGNFTGITTFYFSAATIDVIFLARSPIIGNNSYNAQYLAGTLPSNKCPAIWYNYASMSNQTANDIDLQKNPGSVNPFTIIPFLHYDSNVAALWDNFGLSSLTFNNSNNTTTVSISTIYSSWFSSLQPVYYGGTRFRAGPDFYQQATMMYNGIRIFREYFDMQQYMTTNIRVLQLVYIQNIVWTQRTTSPYKFYSQAFTLPSTLAQASSIGMFALMNYAVPSNNSAPLFVQKNIILRSNIVRNQRSPPNNLNIASTDVMFIANSLNQNIIQHPYEFNRNSQFFIESNTTNIQSIYLVLS